MKWIHNHKVALVWAILVELAAHFLFAFQAFAVGGFIGEVALTVIFGAIGPQVGAYALAIVLFGAAMHAFVLGEYTREHVESYENTGKDGSYLRSFKQIRVIVCLLEIASMLFRCTLIVKDAGWQSPYGYVQAGIIALLSGVLLWYAYAMAKVIHASVNRPIAYDVKQAQHKAGQSLVTDSLKYTDHMTPQQKARFMRGDITAVQEVAQSGFFAEEQKRQAQEQAKLDQMRAKDQAKLEKEQAKIEKERAKRTKQLAISQQEEDARQAQQEADQMAERLFDAPEWNDANTGGYNKVASEPRRFPFMKAQR
jgi:hypothetical protein